MNENVRDALVANATKHRQQVERIRSNRLLSPAGIKAELRRATESAKATDRKLRAKAADDAAKRKVELQRTLFGLRPGADGAALISARDAADRADRCRTADELTSLIASAEAMGDTVLERACFRVAFERAGDPVGGRAWEPLVSHYLDEHPALESTAVEYVELVTDTRPVADLDTRVFTPPELNDRSVTDIEAGSSGAVASAVTPLNA